ncbi:MAG TPA: nicotinate-nucleotide adenylyltransferase [Chthoniobacterales bacterium]|nr:nicotinate-nucleotide adenylyltransferase [Chthoniobacterales bacterium]
MKKIGIFGGSFDPVHHGHLILAREALETLPLDRVLFIPAAQSPHKTAHVPTSAALRWEMLSAAIAGENGFDISRIEIDRPPPSFSIDTVETLRTETTDTQFFFLVGQDNLSELRSWHRFDDLETLVQFVVLDRTGKEAAYDYPAVRRKIDISATTIRNRVASGRSIRYLVPDAVERIIRRENLYQGTAASNPKH